MEGLITAIAQALTSILEKIGVVGRSRRRMQILADLALLKELEGFAELGSGTFAHAVLVNKIIRETAALSDVDLRTTRPDIPWMSILLAVMMMGGTGYWTYVLDESSLRWYSVFPGIFATMMFISILGMIVRKKEETPPSDAELPEQIDCAASKPADDAKPSVMA
jgi:hypothetical protein